MPRLGGEAFSLRRRPQLAAYVKKLPKPNLRNILLALVAFFIVRNLFKNDYRKEEMKYIRSGEQSGAKEIEKAIPMTADEREKFLASRGNDVEKLKHDIHYLLDEIHTLRQRGGDAKGGGGGGGGRDTELKIMDHIHLEKRKAHEEELLKQHPDFVPSKRLNKWGKDKKPDDGMTATT